MSNLQEYVVKQILKYDKEKETLKNKYKKLKSLVDADSFHYCKDEEEYEEEYEE